MSKPFLLELQEKASKNPLWKNENITSEFVTKTINLDLNDYDYFIIFSYLNTETTETISITTIVEKNKNADISYTYYWNGAEIYLRNIKTSNNNIIFGNCSVNGSINNHRLVPYKILGCRY